MKNYLIIIIGFIMASCNNENSLFLVTGYTSEMKNDVVLCRLNNNGSIEKYSGIVAGDNPSYFTLGRNGQVYLVNEVDSFGTVPGGGITTLLYDNKEKSMEKTGSLNQGGGGPCHIVLSPGEKYLVTSNYGSGTVSVIRPDDAGQPSEVTDILRYGEKSHPHMALYNDRLQLWYITDLGLDRIYLLNLRTDEGVLLNADTPYIQVEEGSGPRHMTTGKSLDNLYVANELNSTVSVFDILAAKPVLKQTVSTLPEKYQGKNYCADIHLSENGRYLYVSNRGMNTIAVFNIASDGRLTLAENVPCGGEWPRNFAISPNGRYMLVANQRSDNVSVLRVNKKSGIPVATGNSLPFKAPSCVKFIK